MARKTSNCIQLTNEERFDLEQRSRSLTAPHRNVVRARVILMLADGETISGTARRLSRGRRIVLKWAKRFVRKRLDGLNDAPRSGRPPRFSPGGSTAPRQDGVRVAGGTGAVAVAVDMY